MLCNELNDEDAGLIDEKVAKLRDALNDEIIMAFRQLGLQLL